MARLSEQEINDIRSKADIVDVVGRYVPLSRKGRNYVAKCPFHDDHDPSMSINTDMQIFKCFVCGAGGNVFGFVQKIEKISFIEAVYKVADYAGVHLEHSLALPSKHVDPKLAALYKAIQETIEFTHYQLDTLDAKHVKEYLLKRNLTETIIKDFEIGYNPMDNKLYRFLHAKKVSDEDVLNAGLCRMNAMGVQDIFANRIMIPIHDASGNPVGFTARRINESDEAKYINTQETLVYKKGDLIFNYHRVKNVIRTYQKVILVEGAMDVLAFEKVDLHNALATLGTAITQVQLQLLKQLHAPVVVCYDGDKAGQNATYKFGKLAVKEKLVFEIVDNRYGLDPDEIIDMYGKDELIALSNKTISWVNFLFEFLLKRYNLENYSQKKEFALEMAEAIEGVENDFEKEGYYIRLRELTDFDMHQTMHSKDKDRTKQKPHTPTKTYLTYPKSGRSHAEYEILSQMLHGVAASNYYKEELGFMKDENCNKLAIYIIDYYRSHNEIIVADLLDTIAEEPVKELLINISSWELARNDTNMDVLKEAISKVKDCFIEDQIQILNEKIKHVLDPIEKAKLASEKNQLIQQRGDRFCQGRK